MDEVKTYDVLLNDVDVGKLTVTEEGHSKFVLIPSYVDMKDRPVLGQRFEDDLNAVYRGKKRRLPPFFANLVPEGQLRSVIQNTLNVPDGDEVALLIAAQDDLPGAIRIIEERMASPESEPERQYIPRNGEGTSENEEAEGLRFSLAGVQMKFSVLNESKHVTLPGEDRVGEWIVKLDSPHFPNLVVNEYSMLSWAREAGFDVPTVDLLEVKDLPDPIRRHAPQGRQAFLIQRYDREEGNRVHQEDFNQVVGQYPNDKYEQVRYEDLCALVQAIVGDKALDETIRRLVFMVATGNSDAHLKNWSLVYPDRIHPELSPLYDQVATVVWQDHNLDHRWALKLAGVKDPYHTDEDVFKRLARRVKISEERILNLVDETLDRVADAWKSCPATDLMPSEHVAKLRDYWVRVPILKTHAPALQA